MKKLALAALLLSLGQTALAGSIFDYLCWDYEVSDTGTKGTRGYDHKKGPTSSATSGTFDTVSFNVDGFPKCMGGNSNKNFKKLLNELESSNYNIVLLQEMFTAKKQGFLRDYDRISKGAYPYRSKHWRGGAISFGDGLVRLSDYTFDMNNRDDNDYSLATFEAEEFDECSSDVFGGNPDCMTEKGFTVAVHEISSTFKVHVYNTHMQSGSDGAEVNVKEAQFNQLANFINAYSQGATVILGGDFNAKWEDNKADGDYEVIWENFLATTGLRLACQDIISGADDSIANCAYDHKADTDQVLYRDTDANYKISLDSYAKLGNFGNLSDHEPVRAVFKWSRR